MLIEVNKDYINKIRELKMINEAIDEKEKIKKAIEEAIDFYVDFLNFKKIEININFVYKKENYGFKFESDKCTFIIKTEEVIDGNKN